MSDQDEGLLDKMRVMQQVMLERELDVQQQLDALRAQVVGIVAVLCARITELEQQGKDVSRPAE